MGISSTKPVCNLIKDYFNLDEFDYKTKVTLAMLSL